MSTEPNFFEIHLSDEFEYDLDTLLSGLDEAATRDTLLAGLDEAAPAESPPTVITEKSEFPGSDSSGSALRVSELEKLLLDESEDAKGDAEDAIGGGDVGDYLITDEMECAGDAQEEIMAVDAKEEDDPVSKKRKRQTRNREAAMKSRERKNLYVKELEMKSKYMQMECQRLDFALRCCMAENIALRQSLHRPLGAPMAKQESAVLFVESLLLGSLFWLMSAVCLFLLPVLPIRKQKDVSRLGGSSAQEVVLTGNIANERVGLVVLRRRCRGMKIKMRAMFLSSYITPFYWLLDRSLFIEHLLSF